MTVPVRSGLPGRSLPLVKHLTPCKECPFRRVAAPGWLGGGTVDEWMSDLTFGDCAFVCHMAEAKGKRHFCAGSMIHFRNNLKTPRDPAFADMVMRFAKDTERVFMWAHEFQQHHAAGPLALKRPSASAKALRHD